MVNLCNIQVGQNIELIYQSKINDFSKRTIKVLKINDTTITGFCYLRKEVRTFSINQILALQVVKGIGGSRKCMPRRKKIG